MTPRDDTTTNVIAESVAVRQRSTELSAISAELREELRAQREQAAAVLNTLREVPRHA
ncbi:MAG: hypothetical protein AAGH68_08345 [Pseudomonadota bacterium]